MNRLKLGPIHKIRGNSYSGRIVSSVTQVASQAEGGKFSAAWVPFPVLTAVLGAAIRRLYAGR